MLIVHFDQQLPPLTFQMASIVNQIAAQYLFLVQSFLRVATAGQ